MGYVLKASWSSDRRARTVPRLRRAAAIRAAAARRPAGTAAAGRRGAAPPAGAGGGLVGGLPDRRDRQVDRQVVAAVLAGDELRLVDLQRDRGRLDPPHQLRGVRRRADAGPAEL